LFISLLKREAKASPVTDSSKRTRLFEFIKTPGKTMQTVLTSARWFNEALSLVKLLNELARRLHRARRSHPPLPTPPHPPFCQPIADASKLKAQHSSQMALCLGNSGDFAKAVASYKDSLQILKTANPVDNAEVARVANNLASFYALHWALGDAETYFLEAVKMRTDAVRAAVPSDHFHAS